MDVECAKTYQSTSPVDRSGPNQLVEDFRERLRHQTAVAGNPSFAKIELGSPVLEELNVDVGSVITFSSSPDLIVSQSILSSYLRSEVYSFWSDPCARTVVVILALLRCLLSIKVFVCRACLSGNQRVLMYTTQLKKPTRGALHAATKIAQNP